MLKTIRPLVPRSLANIISTNKSNIINKIGGDNKDDRVKKCFNEKNQKIAKLKLWIGLFYS